MRRNTKIRKLKSVITLWRWLDMFFSDFFSQIAVRLIDDQGAIAHIAIFRMFRHLSDGQVPVCVRDNAWIINPTDTYTHRGNKNTEQNVCVCVCVKCRINEKKNDERGESYSTKMHNRFRASMMV